MSHWPATLLLSALALGCGGGPKVLEVHHAASRPPKQVIGIPSPRPLYADEIARFEARDKCPPATSTNLGEGILESIDKGCTRAMVSIQKVRLKPAKMGEVLRLDRGKLARPSIEIRWKRPGKVCLIVEGRLGDTPVRREMQFRVYPARPDGRRPQKNHVRRGRVGCD